ncbi:hypothetical protein C8J57DRAFT_1381054 [Mycena rebaudengoi]|nr:hypothetical protein C8J57DRAFT_1381054 [Mycena rebaudengoi]
MAFKALFKLVSFMAVVGLVAASPVASSSTAASPAAETADTKATNSTVPGHAAIFNLLQLWQDINMGGNSEIFAGDVNQCIQLGDFSNVASSANILNSGIHCTLWDPDDCTGSGPIISGPADNLNDQGFNDRASSFSCFFT